MLTFSSVMGYVKSAITRLDGRRLYQMNMTLCLILQWKKHKVKYMPINKIELPLGY